TISPGCPGTAGLRVSRSSTSTIVSGCRCMPLRSGHSYARQPWSAVPYPCSARTPKSFSSSARRDSGNISAVTNATTIANGVAFSLRIEDRSGRGEDALEPGGLDREEATEGRVGGLHRGDVVLARDRNLREIVERGHVSRADSRLVEHPPDVGRARMRPRDRLAQPRSEVGAAGDRILLLQRRVEDRARAHDMLLFATPPLEGGRPQAH